MNYYNEIKNELYYEIGRLLTEVGGGYGDNIIEEYSNKLVVEVGKKAKNIIKELGGTMLEYLSTP